MKRHALAKSFLILGLIAACGTCAASPTIEEIQKIEAVNCAPNDVAYWIFGSGTIQSYTSGIAVDANGRPLTCAAAREMLRLKIQGDKENVGLFSR